jgi:transposase
MAILQMITVRESKEELTVLLQKSTPATKPRIKMLLAILSGITSTQELVLKTKSNRDSIRNWKNTYRDEGITGLAGETRGRKSPGAIGNKEKQLLEQKLSDSKGGLTSYKQAMEWINKTFGLEMEYHAVNKYLKRNFKTKLKVGRKTHVNKDENATALFKKPVSEAKTH